MAAICRQYATGGKIHRLDQEKRGQRESKAIPVPDANAELTISLQVLLPTLNVNHSTIIVHSQCYFT